MICKTLSHIALALLASTIFTPCKAVSLETAGTVVGITSVSYLVCKGYGEWVYSRSADRYATARAIVAPVSGLPRHELFQQSLTGFAHLLKQEALYAHNQYCSSFWVTEIPYKNYPLLRYKKSLDTEISRLVIAEYINIGSSRGDDIRALLRDLRLIRQIIISDYDFVKENRYYEIVEKFQHNNLVRFFDKAS